jgi:hypothetical protein
MPHPRLLMSVLAAVSCASGLGACDMLPAGGGSTETGSTSSAAPTGPQAPIADYTAVDQEAAIPDAVRTRVRALPVAMAHASGRDPLVEGLVQLAQQDPKNHAYNVQLLPDKSWLKTHGGLAHFGAGSTTHPDEMIDGFTKRVEADDLGDTAKALYLNFDTADLPSGTQTELKYKQYTTTMDINASRVQLKGVFTEILFAPRIITTGNATFYGGEVPYPIELPNVQVDELHSTLQVPSGAVADDDDGNLLSARDPRMVYNKYQEAVAAVEKAHPAVAMIYATVPLEASQNYQRNYFNVNLRAWCARHRQPLLDVASILAHDQDGKIAMDKQGEHLVAAYAGERGLNAVGKERLAKAWWFLMARIQGWTPPA